jgi:hypothetical protein
MWRLLLKTIESQHGEIYATKATSDVCASLTSSSGRHTIAKCLSRKVATWDSASPEHLKRED